MMNSKPKFRQKLGAVRRCLTVAVLAAFLASWSARGQTSIAAWGLNASGQSIVPTGLTDVVQISGGRDHSVGLRMDGTVVAWGSDNVGPTSVAAGLNDVIAVSAGYGFTLALRANGSVTGWLAGGAPLTNTVVNPPELTNAIAIAAGAIHGLAIRADRTVVAWGANGRGQTNVPADLANVVAIAAGFEHSVALTAEGSVVAWGRNDDGQANAPNTLNDFVAIAAGYFHTLGLRRDGSVLAWGRNLEGQINVPPSALKLAAIAAGGYHSMGLRRDGKLHLWGSAGDGLTSVPPGITNVIAISGGTYHRMTLSGNGAPVFQNSSTTQVAYSGSTIALDGRAAGNTPISYQWQFEGLDIVGATNPILTLTNLSEGLAGNYTVVASNAFGQVSSRNVKVAVVDVAPLLLALGGEAYPPLGSRLLLRAIARGSLPITQQWFRDGVAVINATNGNLIFPAVSAADAGTYTLVASNSFGTTTSAEIRMMPSGYVAWGDPYDVGFFVPADGTNQLAAVAAGHGFAMWLTSDGRVIVRDNDGTEEAQPNVPVGLDDVVAIGAGYSLRAALRSDGRLTWWSGAFVTNLHEITNVISIAAGSGHILALLDDGTVKVFGEPFFPATKTIPVGLSNVVAISAGSHVNAALTHDGRVVVWGPNSSMQTNVPPDLTDAVGVSVGGSHVQAVRSNGEVVAWGAPGDGGTAVPVGLTDAVAVKAGIGYGLAVKRDGSVIGWGVNSVGQTAVPSFLRNVTSLAAGTDFAVAVIGDRIEPSEVMAFDPAVDGGRFQVSVPTRRARTYWLESCTSLSDPVWRVVKGFAGTGRTVVLSDPSAPSSERRYYRIKVY